MNSDPRLYLTARRPNGQDDQDAAIAEALAAAARDPQLEAWASAEQRADALLAAKLRDVAPPPGLRERILAGGQVPKRGSAGKIVALLFRNLRDHWVVAAAAVLLLCAGGLFLLPPRPAGDERSWMEAGAQEVAAIERDGSTGPLDHVVNDLPEIRSWLTSQTCPAPATLPMPVRKLPIFGCAKRAWQGKPLSIVCFAFDRGREVHLVTVERRHLRSAPPEGRPEFSTINGYQTAMWSEGNVAMMLIGKVERAELESLFNRVASRRSAARFGSLAVTF